MTDRSRYEDEALLAEYCIRHLTRDHEMVPVSDEAIYAYLVKTETVEQREEVENALLASRSFCAELLGIADYLESLQASLNNDSIRSKTIALFQRVRRSLRVRPLRRWAVAGLAVSAVVVGVFLVPKLWRTHEPIPTAKHLAVLPITCVAGEPITDAFCDGLAGTVVEKLSRFERFNRSFWVVPAETVAKKKVSQPEEAGRLFGATMALTGRLQRLHDEFKLTLDLISVVAPTPTLLRSTEIVGPIAQLSRLQTSIAEHVSRMLSMQLVPEARAALTAGDTEVAESYRYYVEGRGYLQRYEKTSELEKAIGAFSAAVERDSSFALAHTGLAEAYWRMYRALRDTSWIGKARGECQRALELNGDLAATYVVYGNVLNETGEYEQAISEIQTALSFDSTVAGAYNALADAYARSDRLEEAESTYARAIEVKADYWGGYNDLGFFYYSNGRFADAARQYDRVTELTPDNYLAFSNLGVMYYYLERWDEAKAAFAASIKIQPSDRAYVNLGSIYYIEGDYAESAMLCEEAIKINGANHRYWGALGNAYFWIPGKRDSAIAVYRKAIALAEVRLETNPKDARVIVTLAGYYVVVGEKEKARSYAENALRMSPDKPFVVYFAGHVYEQLGERDKALELIGKAVDLGYPAKEIARDPWLSDFRADERSKRLFEERE